MLDRILLVRGDTRPSIYVTANDETTGTPINLTGATVAMRFRKEGATPVLDTLDGAILSAVAGECRFDWNPTSLADRDAGNYEGEVEITFADGSKQTAYNLVKFKLREDF